MPQISQFIQNVPYIHCIILLSDGAVYVLPLPHPLTISVSITIISYPHHYPHYPEDGRSTYAHHHLMAVARAE